jgi:hypothetical protein
MAGFSLLDSVHGEATDRIGHTGVIDLRHDENPLEMRRLVMIRPPANAAMMCPVATELRAG